MEPPRLLAVVEVPYDERVRCMADGCGHSVYKRVHIVRWNDALLVCGSTCFSRQFHGQEVAKSQPQLTSHAGRMLSAEERLLLISNTEQLIERFEFEHFSTLKTHNPLAERLVKSVWPVRRDPPYHHITKHSPFTAAECAFAEPEARRLLNARFPGLDFDSPGFIGLLRMEIDRILREKMA